MGALAGYVTPPEAVFYFRVAAGVWGQLRDAGVRCDVHRIVRETAERRGIIHA